MSSSQIDRKRKHKDRTIKDLFTTQHKPNLAGAATAPLSPSSKRAKLGSSPAETANPPTPEKTMTTASMYHFPSKRASLGGSDVVDLTTGPDNSPSRQLNALKKTAPNMHANAGPKKLLVKNFKPTRRVDPKVFLEQTWQKVDAALDTIFQQGNIDFSLEELYRSVENLCRQGVARDAKNRLVAKCKAYVGGPLKQRVDETLGRQNVDVLRATLQAWATWNEQLVSWFPFCYNLLAYRIRNTSTGSSATSIAPICSPSRNPCARSPSTSSDLSSLRTVSSSSAL